MAHKSQAPGLMPDGRTSDGRYTIDVNEYAAIRGISPATAWRLVRAGHIRSIQSAGKNGRVQIPVLAVLNEIGLERASGTGGES
jgi:hypothetical protein